MTKATKMKVERLVTQIKDARAIVSELEAGVTGTLYTPSQSDQEPGRVCSRDILHSKGDKAYSQWLDAKVALSKAYDEMYRMRIGPARTMVIREL